MDELTIGDKIYISSKQAAKITGYAKDYVGQLCREGRVEARLVGRNWYVLESSIREHRFGAVSEPIEEVNAAPEVEVGSVTAWEAPVYRAVQEETILPPLESPKTPATSPDTTEAVALMQDAWKEWFATRGQSQPAEEEKIEEETHPEEEKVPQEDIEEAVRVSDIPSNEAIFPVSQAVEEESPVFVTRVEEREVVDAYVEPIQYAQPVVTTRIHRDPRAARGVIDLSQAREEVAYEPVPPVTRHRRKTSRRNGGLVTQAILASFAGLAIVIAVIGSGVLDSALATPGVNDGLRGTVIDVIRGESTIKK